MAFSIVCSASGLPAIIVAASLGITAGKDGIETFISDTKYVWGLIVFLFYQLLRKWWEPGNVNLKNK